MAAPVPAPSTAGTGLHRLPLGAALLLVLVLPAACTRTDPGVAALQQRVQQLEDQEAIRQVLVEYGERLDSRDFAGYAALFAREGTWTGGFGTFTGPAAIQAMLEKNIGTPPPDFINKTSFHLMTTMVVEVHGDAATARSRYLFFTATPEDRPGAAMAGRYIDDFVREDGQWKILRRTTHGVIPWRDGSQPPP